MTMWFMVSCCSHSQTDVNYRLSFSELTISDKIDIKYYTDRQYVANSRGQQIQKTASFLEEMLARELLQHMVHHHTATELLALHPQQI